MSKATKKPAAATPPEQPPPIDPAVVDKIVLLMTAALRPAEIRDTCIEKLGLDPADVPEAIAAARTKITRAARYDPDELLGEAITRLDDIYQRCLGVQDTKTALAAQREKHRLLGIGPTERDPAPGPDDPDGEVPTTAAERRRIEDAELAAIVDAIEAHLEPVGLPGAASPHTTDAEMIEAAGKELVRLARALKRAKPARKKPAAKRKAPRRKTAKQKTAKKAAKGIAK